MLVMLRSDWPGDTFRRGGVEFQRGVPNEIDDTALKAVAKDIGKALVFVDPMNAKADHDSTSDFCRWQSEQDPKTCDVKNWTKPAKWMPPVIPAAPPEDNSNVVTDSAPTKSKKAVSSKQ